VHKIQGWGPRGLAYQGQNLAAFASNHHGLGLDAAQLSLGVSVLVAGIYAGVILTLCKNSLG
jgi:hypothetical protein